MPELPECDWLAGVVKRHALGNSLKTIEVVRANKHYFGMVAPTKGVLVVPVPINDVFRVGKQVVMDTGDWKLVTHNAMTGYFDWEHEPETFDYVEGARTSTDADVRVRLTFVDGKVLRFHDARLFGRMNWEPYLPVVGPELMLTPHGHNQFPVIRPYDLWELFDGQQKPIKHMLMDQRVLAGIGNIYASEGCHLAGIDPNMPAGTLSLYEIDLLLEALRCVVSNCIPTVGYQWLKVYRRDRCGTCDSPVIRTMTKGRATFACGRCQGPLIDTRGVMDISGTDDGTTD